MRALCRCSGSRAATPSQRLTARLCRQFSAFTAKTRADPFSSSPLDPSRHARREIRPAQLAHELLRRRRDDHRARGFQGAQTAQFHRVQQREETGLLPQKLARPPLQTVSKHMPVARLAERSGDDPRARRGARQFRVRRNDALEQSKEGAQAPQRDPQLMHRFRVADLAQRRDISREVIETVAKDTPDGAVEGIRPATGPSHST